MKIAYLVNQYPAISHTFIRREILALEARGIEIARFSIRMHKDPLVDEADKDEKLKTTYLLNSGFFVLSLSLFQAIIKHPIRFSKAFWISLRMANQRDPIVKLAYLIEACVLLKHLTRLRINHVHAHFATNSSTVAMLCSVLGGPAYSFTAHGAGEVDSYFLFSLPEKIHRAAFVVAISSFGRSQLFRVAHYADWGKIKLVHCGLDKMFLEQKYVALPTKPKFIAIGRMDAVKGHLLLVEAVAELVSEGLIFKLIMVGGGPLRNEIEGLIKKLKLEDYVQVIGWASNEEVVRQILSSSVLVLPSFSEGLPVVIMEAFALGRPVIASAIAGIPELVKNGENGWLIPAGSREALKEAMRSALSVGQERLSDMGKCGLEHVRKEHNIETESGKLAELFSTSGVCNDLRRIKKNL